MTNAPRVNTPRISKGYMLPPPPPPPPKQHGAIVNNYQYNYNYSEDSLMYKKLLLNSSWQYLEKVCERYLWSCHTSTMNGCLKATMHIELCNYYVSLWLGHDYKRGTDNDHAEELWEVIHDETQYKLTNALEKTIEFPWDDVEINPCAYGRTFFEEFHKIAMNEIKLFTTKYGIT